MTTTKEVIDFREHLRHFERELGMQNSANCCGGVTLSQCHTLMEIEKQTNISLKDLSERLYLDKSTTSRIIESLVNMGLVDREIPQNNRRTIIIKLTDEGVKVCEKINSENNQYFQKVLDSLSADQLEQFLNSFKIVVSKMVEENNKKCSCS